MKEGKRPGRPLAPLDPGSSKAAQLGAELRARRQARGLTLKALGELASYSIQHISSVERAKTSVSRPFVAACDRALGAEGVLLALVPAVVCERAMQLHDRAAARRLAADGGRYDEDVDPTNRRGLLEAGTATALGGLGVAAAAPAAARDIDPALVGHWTALLALLGGHDDAHGPREVLGVARNELRLITDHRAVARGDLRMALMRVEARWAVHTGWLYEDAGDRRGRDALLEHALRLAREADHQDVAAWARARQAQWSDPPRAVRLAEAGLRTPRASPQAKALCAMRAAHAHAQIGDSGSAERMLAKTEGLIARDSPPPPMSRDNPVVEHDVRCWEARCWAALAPTKAIPLYEAALRDWPRGESHRGARDGGLYQARLAVACAKAGELDRARSEGRKALVIARATGSSVAARELKQLGQALRAD